MTVTFVCAGQYSFGRQSTREPPPSSGSQPHEPSTGAEVSTESACSAAARSATWPLNWMRIGAATPTVRPSPMLIVPRIFLLGGRVANVPASGTAVPSTAFALPPQVYVTP